MGLGSKCSIPFTSSYWQNIHYRTVYIWLEFLSKKESKRMTFEKYILSFTKYIK